MMKPKRAVIIGSGIAGPAVALFCRRAGLEPIIYEARSRDSDAAGFFYNLAPNGMNVLKALGLHEQVAACGYPTAGIDFFNAAGRRIGRLDNSDEAERYGVRSVMLKRSALIDILRSEVARQGIPIIYDRKLVRAELSSSSSAVAHFEDGERVETDLFIGCDGIHSRTRRSVFPDAPAPAYTGIVDCGGFSYPSASLPPTERMHMTFGRQAFFGHLIKPDGEVFWFSNIAWPAEPRRGELDRIPFHDWRQRLLDQHRADPSPIPQLIEANDGQLGKWPIYDLPSIPEWHRGPVVLIGDAAHATSPHVGQGASLALEDAMVLAQCLRDLPDRDQAFAAYVNLRRERVEKAVAQARQTGDQKVAANPIAIWFRDLMLPMFLKMGARAAQQMYDYRIDWNARVAG